MKPIKRKSFTPQNAKKLKRDIQKLLADSFSKKDIKKITDDAMKTVKESLKRRKKGQAEIAAQIKSGQCRSKTS